MGIPTQQPGTTIQSVESIDKGKALRITWSDERQARFHALWLRDNSLDPQTRSTQNGQRLITLNELDNAIAIRVASLKEDGIRLEFTHEDQPVDFEAGWLRANAYDRTPEAATIDTRPKLADQQQAWDQSLDIETVTHDFSRIMADETERLSWLRNMQRFGVTRLSDGPIRETSLLEVVAQFGFVRETNYGPVFNVRTEIKPGNLAFTNLGLQAHTDNPYRDPVPTLQILYCLENSASGGENEVVDGFKAATRLFEENEAGFDLLTRYNAKFEYHGDNDVHLSARKPMIEMDVNRTLRCIRFNNRSIAPLSDIPFEQMQDYYSAYRRLGEIIDEAAMKVEFRLEPGECFIVDNTRVLHGRKEYDTASGKRWLQGCYADNDGLLSTLAVLERRLSGEVA